MNPIPKLTFILGGARSGKSDYALELARRLAGDQAVLFVATAQAGDEEIREMRDAAGAAVEGMSSTTKD